MKTPIDKALNKPFSLQAILNEIFFKFIATDVAFITLNPREYFSKLEEARWFLIDFYGITEITLRNFTEIIFIYTNIIPYHQNCLDDIFKLKKKALVDAEINKIFIKYFLHKKSKSNTRVSATLSNISMSKFLRDYNKYILFKKSVMSYGAIVFSADFKKFLLVKQLQGGNYTFPKGKLEHGETPKQCAIRETYEETGINIEDNITNLTITIFNKITFFIATNVNIKHPLESKVRNEISEIFWADVLSFLPKGDSKESTEQLMLTNDDISTEVSENNEEGDMRRFKIVNIAFSALLKPYKLITGSLFNLNNPSDSSADRNKKLYKAIAKL